MRELKVGDILEVNPPEWNDNVHIMEIIGSEGYADPVWRFKWKKPHDHEYRDDYTVYQIKTFNNWCERGHIKILNDTKHNYLPEELFKI